MSSLMMRSFADAWGLKWPADVAYVIDGKRVTYAEVRKARKGRQAEHLARVLRRDGPCRRPAHLWVFFVPGMIYGGWHLYLRTHKDSWWLKRPEGIALDLMAAFPCGILPIAENFHAWKEAFGASYRSDVGNRKQAIIRGWVECDRDGGRPLRFDPRNPCPPAAICAAN